MGKEMKNKTQLLNLITKNGNVPMKNQTQSNRLQTLALILGTLLASTAATTARADQFLIVTPVGQGFEAALKEVAKNPLVVKATPVFTESEQKALGGMGESMIASSLKLRLKTHSACKRVRLWATAQFPSLKVERNVEALKDDPIEPSSPLNHPNNLNPYQWGLNNTGLPQELTQELKTDDIRSIFVPGVVGEDIDFARAGPEKISPAPARVAVLDSGLDLTHPAFKGQIITKSAECTALDAYKKCLTDAGDDETKKTTCDTTLGQVDADGNGYPLDCHGWSVAGAVPGDSDQPLGSGDPQDTIGHGTHVAGVIGAAINDRNYRGILEHVNLIPVRVIDKNPNNPVRPQSDGESEAPSPKESQLHAGLGFGDLLARGMLYAIRSQAQVVNMSLAWPASADSQLMRKMVALAQSKGIVIVASAGNDSNDAQVFPCAYPGVVCVAAHGPDGAITHFSNFGPFVDVAAPGFRILSTFPKSMTPDIYTELKGYDIKNGTSMAAPFVTGVIARLINDGYSPQEAVARLYLSARATKSNPLRSTQLLPKDIRFGNIDLAAAYKVSPQPLILPSDKEIVRIGWDGKSLSIPVTLKLKNIYKDATTPLDIKLSVMDSGPGSREASIDNSTSTQSNWKSNEERTISTSLKLASDRVDGRLSIVAQVLSQGKELNRFRIPLEIAVKIDSIMNNPAVLSSFGAQSLPITGSALAGGSSMRTITQQDPKAGNQYLTVVRGQANWQLQVVNEQPNGYVATAAVNTATIAGDLFEVDHLPAIAGGVAEQYVLIARIAPEQGKKQQRFLFRFLDSQLATKQEVIFNNSPTVINDRFQWMQLAGTWVPGWVERGNLPDSEASDPNSATGSWGLDPAPMANYRFYYFTLDGKAHSVKAPDEDSQFVNTVAQTPEERSSGSVAVILGKGQSYEQTFTKAHVTQGKLVVGEQLTFSGDYMQLMTAAGTQAVLNQQRLGGTIGTMFSKISTPGSTAMAIVPVNSSNVTFSTNVSSLNSQTDSVIQATGIFEGASKAGAFVQTHYDLEFHDLGNSEGASTSLNRFSFLPTFVQQKSFFPILVQDSRNPTGERLPAVLVPNGLGDSISSEIVMPVYQSNHLVGLSRPAKLKLLDSQTCTSLGRPRPADATSEGAIVFFCGDKMVKVPIRY